MKLALVETGIKSVFPEAAEYFPDVLLVFGEGVGVDEDVVEINDHEFIDEVGENVVHKTLESGGSVRQTKGDHEPFERSIACAESGFPFVAFRDPDQMICVPEVDLCIITRLSRSVKEIGDERKRVPVLFGDLVKGAVVATEAETSVLFLDEHDRSSVRGTGGTNVAQV
jgi:hypothetical protein